MAVFAAAAAWGLALAGATAPGTLHAFPDKPIRLIVSGPAGGTADIVARTFAPGVAETLGQPVVVDNKPGGAGIIALQSLLRNPADGHALKITVNGLVSEVPHAVKMPVDPLVAIEPIAELARAGLVLVANNDVPANHLGDLLAHISSRPGKVSYASYSAGTISHTLGVRLAQIAQSDMLHVGYRGSPPALNDLVSGQVQLMFDSPVTAWPLIKSGKIKAIATTHPARLEALPNVPTVQELGYPQLTETAWLGVWGPRGLSDGQVTVIRTAFLKELRKPQVRAMLTRIGLEAGGETTVEEMKRSLRMDSARQAELLRSIGFKPE